MKEFLLSILSFLFGIGGKPVEVIDPAIELEEVKVVEMMIDTRDNKDINAFLYAIGQRESGGDYSVVNSYGYMGKYQFGRRTLNKLGYRHISNKEFLSSPEIQEQVMIRLLEHNKYVLRRHMHNVGKRAYGIEITESGMLAAAHLLGPGKVRRFLRNGKIYRDGYGTPITEYLERFGGYDTSKIISRR